MRHIILRWSTSTVQGTCVFCCRHRQDVLFFRFSNADLLFLPLGNFYFSPNFVKVSRCKIRVVREGIQLSIPLYNPAKSVGRKYSSFL